MLNRSKDQGQGFPVLADVEFVERTFFINWYRKKGRSFPWRESSTTPFQMLVTEMLLRQTRAKNVATIWRSFIDDYPTANAIVNADPEGLVSRVKVLGLGEQRASALQSAAAWLIKYHQGNVPTTLQELMQVPHIGNYSARAILSFAFSKRFEIVDTNVLRLFSRYFGIQLAPDIRRTPEAWRIAQQLLPKSKVKEHNYGMLDFTAEICKPRKPLCSICSLSGGCCLATTTLSCEI